MFNSYPVSFSRDFPIDDKSISQKNLKLVFFPHNFDPLHFPEILHENWIQNPFHGKNPNFLLPSILTGFIFARLFDRCQNMNFSKITCDSRRDMRQEIPYRTSRRSWVCGSNRHDPVRIANFWVFCCKFHKTFLLEMHYLWRSCASSRCVPATGSP